MLKFNNELAKIAEFAATGKVGVSTLTNAVDDVTESFLKAQGLKIIEPSDIDEFMGATRELGVYREALAEVVRLGSQQQREHRRTRDVGTAQLDQGIVSHQQTV